MSRHDRAGKLGLSVSPRGVENVVFLQDRRSASDFYNLIEGEIQKFERGVLEVVRQREMLVTGVRNERKN